MADPLPTWAEITPEDVTAMARLTAGTRGDIATVSFTPGITDCGLPYVTAILEGPSGAMTTLLTADRAVGAWMGYSLDTHVVVSCGATLALLLADYQRRFRLTPADDGYTPTVSEWIRP